MREREEVEFAWRYRRWRALILATSSHFGDERTGEPGWERGAWHLLGGDARVDYFEEAGLEKGPRGVDV